MRFPLSPRHALALAAAATIAAPLAAQDAPDRRATLAIMDFTNSALGGRANADYEPLRKGMADILINELAANNPNIRIVEREHIQAILEEQNLATSGRVDANTAVRVGKVLGARYMLFGSFFIDLNNRLRLDLRAVNVETSQVGERGEVFTVSGKSEDILDKIQEIAQQVSKKLNLPAIPAQSSGDAGAGSSSAATAATTPTTTTPIPTTPTTPTTGTSGSTAPTGSKATTGSTATTTKPASARPPAVVTKPVAVAQSRAPSGGKPAELRSVLAMSRAIDQADKKNTTQAVALYNEALKENPNNRVAAARLSRLQKGT